MPAAVEVVDQLGALVAQVEVVMAGAIQQMDRLELPILVVAVVAAVEVVVVPMWAEQVVLV
jgi:hypothetical protein